MSADPFNNNVATVDLGEPGNYTGDPIDWSGANNGKIIIPRNIRRVKPEEPVVLWTGSTTSIIRIESEVPYTFDVTYLGIDKGVDGGIFGSGLTNNDPVYQITVRENPSIKILVAGKAVKIEDKQGRLIPMKKDDFTIEVGPDPRYPSSRNARNVPLVNRITIETSFLDNDRTKEGLGQRPNTALFRTEIHNPDAGEVTVRAADFVSAARQNDVRGNPLLIINGRGGTIDFADQQPGLPQLFKWDAKTGTLYYRLEGVAEPFDLMKWRNWPQIKLNGYQEKNIFVNGTPVTELDRIAREAAARLPKNPFPKPVAPPMPPADPAFVAPTLPATYGTQFSTIRNINGKRLAEFPAPERWHQPIVLQLDDFIAAAEDYARNNNGLPVVKVNYAFDSRIDLRILNTSGMHREKFFWSYKDGNSTYPVVYYKIPGWEKLMAEGRLDRIPHIELPNFYVGKFDRMPGMVTIQGHSVYRALNYIVVTPPRDPNYVEPRRVDPMISDIKDLTGIDFSGLSDEGLSKPSPPKPRVAPLPKEPAVTKPVYAAPASQVAAAPQPPPPPPPAQQQQIQYKLLPPLFIPPEERNQPIEPLRYSYDDLRSVNGRVGHTLYTRSPVARVDMGTLYYFGFNAGSTSVNPYGYVPEMTINGNNGVLILENMPLGAAPQKVGNDFIFNIGLPNRQTTRVTLNNFRGIKIREPSGQRYTERVYGEVMVAVHQEPPHQEPRHVEKPHVEPRHIEAPHVEPLHQEPRYAERPRSNREILRVDSRQMRDDGFARTIHVRPSTKDSELDLREFFDVASGYSSGTLMLHVYGSRDAAITLSNIESRGFHIRDRATVDNRTTWYYNTPNGTSMTVTFWDFDRINVERRSNQATLAPTITGGATPDSVTAPQFAGLPKDTTRSHG